MSHPDVTCEGKENPSFRWEQKTLTVIYVFIQINFNQYIYRLKELKREIYITNLQKDLSHGPPESRHDSSKHNEKESPEFKLSLLGN